MRLSFGHDKFGGLVDAIVRAVPINDHAVDSTTDHVRDLIVNLRRVCRTVPNIHMIRSTEP